MKILIPFVAALVFATSACAQAPANKTTDAIGVWRGTSLCLVRPSACHDEVVVYRIAQIAGSDSLAFDARKIVNGQEEEMGVLHCTVDAAGAALACPMRNGMWRFWVRGDSLVGDLRRPDNTKFRDVRTARSH